MVAWLIEDRSIGVASADLGAVLMLATAAGPLGTCEEYWWGPEWPTWVVVMVLPLMIEAIGETPALGEDTPVAEGVTMCLSVDSCDTEGPDLTV